MKKFLKMFLASFLVFGLVACSSKDIEKKEDEKPAQTEKQPEEQKEETSGTPVGLNPAEAVLFPKTSPDAPGYATIKVSETLQLEEDAWLGLCPTGKDYITEEEADDVEVIYSYAERREEGDPYVFACDYSEVADGTYALVLCTSDRADVGYVIIQAEMTKNGDNLTFNFENAKLNEKPNN